MYHTILGMQLNSVPHVWDFATGVETFGIKNGIMKESVTCPTTGIYEWEVMIALTIKCLLHDVLTK